MKSNTSLSNPIYVGASPKLLELARQLRINMINSESLLWDKLRNKQLLAFKFRRQHPILTFIVDFYCYQAKLVIEVDGGYHNKIHQHEYDLGRTDELDLHGIRVICFTNNEVEKDIEMVIGKIVEHLNKKV